MDHDAGLSNPDRIADVFINRDLEANSGTTALRTYTDAGISLRMTFRVDCHDDYYGSACTVFCQPRNDNTNGHYNCDPDDGSHICLPDYYNAPACNVLCQARDDDTNGHFTCDPDDGSHVCLPDYYGMDCLTLCQPVEGFYSCHQQDGSRICAEGFTNPGNFCRESELCYNNNNILTRNKFSTFTCPTKAILYQLAVPTLVEWVQKLKHRFNFHTCTQNFNGN